MALDHSSTTALVTGASSGLGEEFARQLAARGANLILVARRADRLESLAAELRAAAGVTVTVIAADLSLPGSGSALATRVSELGLSVDTLVNNAGFGTHARFEHEDPAVIQEQIALNVAALVGITRAFYPRMLQQGRGALITVASNVAYQPVPLMAVYGATKAFVLSFTEALWYEAKGSGLTVFAISPGGTRTEFFDSIGEVSRLSSMQSAAEVVAFTLKTIDRRNPPPSRVSGVMNRINATASGLAPRRIAVSATGALMGRTPPKSGAVADS